MYCHREEVEFFFASSATSSGKQWQEVATSGKKSHQQMHFAGWIKFCQMDGSGACTFEICNVYYIWDCSGSEDQLFGRTLFEDAPHLTTTGISNDTLKPGLIELSN